MATDGPDPEPCDARLFKDGKVIAVVGETGGSNHFERLIRAASRRAGVPIDWHFAGGRAIVLAFEKDAQRATEAFKAEVYPVLMGGAPEGTVLAKEAERIL